MPLRPRPPLPPPPALLVSIPLIRRGRTSVSPTLSVLADIECSRSSGRGCRCGRRRRRCCRFVPRCLSPRILSCMLFGIHFVAPLPTRFRCVTSNGVVRAGGKPRNGPGYLQTTTKEAAVRSFCLCTREWPVLSRLSVSLMSCGALLLTVLSLCLCSCSSRARRVWRRWRKCARWPSRSPRCVLRLTLSSYDDCCWTDCCLDHVVVDW